jgi:hypothetical protein
MFRYFIVFLAGFFFDLLITKYTLDVTHRKVISASILSGLINVVNFLFIVILLKNSVQDSIIDILIYCVGNSIGTYVAMKYIK